MILEHLLSICLWDYLESEVQQNKITEKFSPSLRDSLKRSLWYSFIREIDLHMEMIADLQKGVPIMDLGNCEWPVDHKGTWKKITCFKEYLMANIALVLWHRVDFIRCLFYYIKDFGDVTWLWLGSFDLLFPVNRILLLEIFSCFHV